ncbi:hypothetical protein [Ruegeria sp. AD91A]|uniref:hypothetical protein n=1 Tax=Ruegeria sp. AD91A TaxID=2293862 RepID=UPI0013C2BE04|nr:hypothetical protein [Ruegeria sp. AD91A]
MTFDIGGLLAGVRAFFVLSGIRAKSATVYLRSICNLNHLFGENDFPENNLRLALLIVENARANKTLPRWSETDWMGPAKQSSELESTTADSKPEAKLRARFTKKSPSAGA